jgi:hypothetical protein
MFVLGPWRSSIATDPGVVGVHVIWYGRPTGMMVERGALMGLQPSVHCVV